MPTRKKITKPSSRRPRVQDRKRSSGFLTALSQAAGKRMTLADLRNAGFQLPSSKKLRARAREIFERARSMTQRPPAQVKRPVRSRARKRAA